MTSALPAGLPKETDMRGSCLPALAFLALPLTLTIAAPTQASAQVPGPTSRTLAVPVEPIVPTKIESLLTAANVVLVTDYYYVDTRFGPNLRIDAMVVEAVDEKTRLKGLRVQVRDPESRGRQEGVSYIDLEEAVQLSNGLAIIMKLEPRWTHDERRATESTFTTTGGFRLAIRQSPRGPRAYLSTGLIDPVVTWIEVGDLASLKSAFDQALSVLNGK
jgi:hypothetical protein